MLLAWALPLACGLTLRLTGIRHGAPDLVFHPDVAKQALAAISGVAAGRDLAALFGDNTELTHYPYGMAVMLGGGQAIYHRLTGRPGLAGLHRWTHAFALRLLATGLSLFAVALLLPCLARQVGWPAASMAGLLLLAEPHGSQLSHYGMNDVPLAAALLLAWLCAWRLADRGPAAPGAAVCCGLCIGIGFGIKYQALLGALLPAAALLAVWPRDGLRPALMAGFLVVVGATAGAWIACPLLWRDPAFFLRGLPEFMRWQAHVTGTPLPLAAKVLRNAQVLLALLAGSGRWLMVAGAAGFVLLALRGRRRDAFTRVTLAGLLLALILMLLLVVGRDLVRPNDLLPIHAFLALACGGLLGRYPRSLRWVAWPGAAAAAGAFILVAGADSAALSRPDTRVAARDWCRSALPGGARVAEESYVLPIGRPDLHEQRRRSLADPRLAQGLAAGDFDYAIRSSLASGRFFDRLSPYFDPERQTAYRNLENGWDVAAVFRDRELLHAHPVVTVYRRPR